MLLIISVSSLATPNQEVAKQFSVATFAGGCFWCMEPPFDKTSGVTKTTSGYMGGHLENPSYKDVSSGLSGHIEVIQIEYDPDQIDYSDLLKVYWRNIDPTDGKGQFCDKGNQYRPVIFYHDQEQFAAARTAKQELQENKPFTDDIVVEILPAKEFYAAEEYHQDYYLKNPIRYKYYRYSCGRDQRLDKIWGDN